MSASIFEYTSIETLAKFYVKTMALGELYFNRLQVRVHRHKHEYLISNFDDEIAALCAFLDIDVDPNMRNVVETTNRRDVRTPSARQIRQGLNLSGVGYWKNYRSHLEPQLPLLEPWVLKFGYESSFLTAPSSETAG
jgi:hypothetical protein